MNYNVRVQVKDNVPTILSGGEEVLSLDGEVKMLADHLTKDSDPSLLSDFGVSFVDIDVPEWHTWENGLTVTDGVVTPTYTPLPVNEVKTIFTHYMQQRMDGLAQQYGYDNIASAVSYANSTVEKFRTEALMFSALRDEVWSKSYALLDAYTETPPAVIDPIDVIVDGLNINWPQV